MMLDPHAIKEGEAVNITTSLICLAANIPGALFWVGMERVMSKTG
jgi:hypothetical protein